MTPAPVVSVVVVSWNVRDHLVGCLRSLSDNPPSCEWEVVVVDNASTDGSGAAARATLPTATVIENATNRGLAAANNQGVVAARGAEILVANPDVTFTPGAIDALRDVMRRRVRAGVVVPQLVQPDGARQVSAGSLPGVADALFGRFSRRAWWREWGHDEERLVGRGAEACYLIRRRALADAGAFDERFVLDWEGIEWSARLVATGWEVWFTPAARIVHAGGASVRQVPFRWVASSHLGMYRYLRRRHPVLAPLYAPLIAARAAVRASAVARGVAIYDRARAAARLPER